MIMDYTRWGAHGSSMALRVRMMCLYYTVSYSLYSAVEDLTIRRSRVVTVYLGPHLSLYFQVIGTVQEQIRKG
jgi:hypothetical protein